MYTLTLYCKNTTFCDTVALNAIVTRHIQHSRTQIPSVTTKPCEMRTNWIQHNFCNNSCVVRVQICTRECSLNGHSVSTQVPVSAMWKCDVGRDNRINNKGCVLNAVGSNVTELYSHGQNIRLRSRVFVVFTNSHVLSVWRHSLACVFLVVHVHASLANESCNLKTFQYTRWLAWDAKKSYCTLITFETHYLETLRENSGKWH